MRTRSFACALFFSALLGLPGILTGQNLVPQPTSLQFPNSTGSFNPQFIFLNSSPSVQFQATTTTFSGGNWLTVASTAGTTPAFVEVRVNTANLANGTYSGTVNFTSSGAQAVSVPVTLTVGPVGLVSPSALTFNAAVGGAAQTQTFTITPPVAAAYTATTTTASGGVWLQVTPNSGTAAPAAVVSVVANPFGLAQGTYSGTVTVVLAGQPTQTVSVTLVVGGGGGLVNPSALTFSSSVGGSLQQGSFTITTPTASSFTTSLATSNGVQWLAVGPQFGNTAANTPFGVTVFVNPSSPQSLGVGTHTGTITVTIPGQPAQTVSVTLTVGNPLVNPSSLTFSSPVGGLLQQGNFSITTPTASSFTTSVSTTNGGGWLAVGPQFGNTFANTPFGVTVFVNPSSPQALAAGTYSGTITLAIAGQPTQTISVNLTVSNPVLVNPSSLTFSSAMGGSMQQGSFTVTTATATSFTTSVSTTNGGGWLAVGPQFGSTAANTPFGVTVFVNPSSPQTLAAGTYTATITLMIQGQPAQTVSVTLNVGSGSGGLVSPTSLTLNVPVNSSVTTQTFTINTTSAANYTITPQTLSGGNWLSTTPTNGTTQVGSTVINVAVNPFGLAAGTYSGTLVISIVGQPQTSIGVTMIVGGGGGSGAVVSPTSLAFTSPVGGSVLRQTLTITTPANSTYSATVTTSSGGNWLSQNPTSGITTPTAIALVGVNPLGLAAGTYSGQIVFAIPGQLNVTVPVTLTVGGGGGGSGLVTPASLVFTSARNGGQQSETITVNTTVPSSYSATASGSFISVIPTGGQTIPTAIVTVTVTPAGLAAGTYTGSVTITSGSTSQVVPVTLIIQGSSGPLSPTQLSFTTQPNVPPPNQTFTITTASPTTYSVSGLTNSGGNWLFVGPASGITIVQGGQSVATAVIQAGINTTGLALGTYTGSIDVNVGGQRHVVGVTVTVGTGPVYPAVPSQLTFNYQSGTIPPLAQVISITPSGGNAQFTATATTNLGGNWLKVTPSSGSSALFVEVNPTGLAVGAYSGTVAVTISGETQISVPVLLDVSTSALLQVNQTSLTFNYQQGGAAPVQQAATIDVATTDGKPLEYVATASVSTGSGWLTLTSSTGTAPGTVSVMVNASNLPAGTYLGSVSIRRTNGLPTVVQVVLNVSNSPLLTVSPQAIQIVHRVGSANPAPVAVTITSTGTAVSFSQQMQVHSGAGWLTATPANGLTPGTLQVTVIPAGLPAGAYFGTVQVTAPGTPASTIPVILTVTTTPQTLAVSPVPQTFTQTQGGPPPPAQTLNISSSGSSVPFTLTSTTLSGGNWFSVSPASGATPRQLSVSIVPNSLAVGTYSGSIIVTAPGAVNSPQVIPITLRVGSQPVTPTVTPTIETPTLNTRFTAPGTISFSGSATDTTDGNLPAEALRWRIELIRAGTATNISTDNGLLGGSFQTTSLAPTYDGFYRITLTATNSRGVSASVFRDVLPALPDPGPGLKFVPVTPCRIVDTRTDQGISGAFGPPAFDAGQTRTFPIPQGRCNIPATAKVYSLNVTVVPKEPLAFLTMWPAGATMPTVSTLNSLHGGIVANAAMLPAGDSGAIAARATGRTELIIDINGYFVEQGQLSFYAVAPCRAADTRSGSGFTGLFGAPTPLAATTREFPLISSPCNLPQAGAYSLNFTAVPSGPLGFLTAWAAGSPQPVVSTLNSPEGAVVANAAIVPAGSNGAINTFVTNRTDVVLDANGYFAAPGAANELTFRALIPCRVVDTRNEFLGAPVIRAQETRDFAFGQRCGVPSTARAVSVNVTVVPSVPLSYLTLWPSDRPQPLVSTLNSFLGRVVANAALVPAGPGATVRVFATDETHVVLDVNGYFQ